MSIDKKKSQLGIHPSTASGKLVKDLLYKFVVQTGNNLCFRCGQDMTRETFSIEHKTAWLDSDEPFKTFFDLDNISFSHLSCNTIAGKRRTVYNSDVERKAAKVKQTLKWRSKPGNERTPVSRRLEYQRRKSRLAEGL